MSAFMHDFSVNVYTQELHLTFIFSTIKKKMILTVLNIWQAQPCQDANILRRQVKALEQNINLSLKQQITNDLRKKIVTLQKPNSDASSTTVVPLKNTAFRKLRESLIVDWQKPNAEIRGKSQPKHVGPPFYGNQTRKVRFCFAFNKGGKCKYFPCRYSHFYQLCNGTHPELKCPSSTLPTRIIHDISY